MRVRPLETGDWIKVCRIIPAIDVT